MATSDYTPKTRRALGHDFRPMDQVDFDDFAGADPGSWISDTDDGGVLILSPDGMEVCAIDGDLNETLWRLVR